MEDKYKISIKDVTNKEGRCTFTILVEFESKQKEYIIDAFRQDILLKDDELTTEKLKEFAIAEMEDWIKRSKGLPNHKFLQLANGGKIPKDKIDENPSKKEEVLDLVRTNVTIFAPLFEWAKAKAHTEGTSFSDLVSRGLLMLKDSDKEIEAWFREQGVYFRKKLGDFGSFELFHYLPNNYSEFSVDTLKEILQQAQIRRTGWPIGAYLSEGDQRPHPQQDGIKAEYTPSEYLLLDYWYAKNKGELYFARNLESDSRNGKAKPKTSLYFDTLVWRVAESIEHCLVYYQGLNIDQSERVKIKISLNGLNGRILSAWNPMRAFTLSHYTCGADKSSWEIEVTLKELREQLDDVIYEAVKKLLLMFDFFVPNKTVVFDILNREYRKSNM